MSEALSTVRSPRKRAKVVLMAALQVAVSVGILLALFQKADWQLLGDTLASVDATWFFAAIAVLSFQQMLSANRWRVLTKVLGGKGLHAAGYLLWQGLAVLLLQVLPSTVGGDIVRAGSGARAEGLGLGVGVVVVERAIGMVVLCAFVIVGAGLFSSWLYLQPALLVPLLMAVAGAGVAVFLMVMSGWLKARKFAFKLDALGDALRTSLSVRQGVFVWLSSLFIHLLSIVAVSLLLSSAQVGHYALHALFFVVPSALLVSALPISLGGWGVREGAFVVGLGLMGIEKEQALGISVLFGISLTGAGFVLATMGAFSHGVLFLQGAVAREDSERKT